MKRISSIEKKRSTGTASSLKSSAIYLPLLILAVEVANNTKAFKLCGVLILKEMSPCYSSLIIFVPPVEEMMAFKLTTQLSLLAWTDIDLWRSFKAVWRSRTWLYRPDGAGCWPAGTDTLRLNRGRIEGYQDKHTEWEMSEDMLATFWLIKLQYQIRLEG